MSFALFALFVDVPAFVPLFVVVGVALGAALVDSVVVDVSTVVAAVVAFASWVDVDAAAGDVEAVVVLASFVPEGDCVPPFALFVEVSAVVIVLGEETAVEVSVLVVDAAGVGAAVGPSAHTVVGMTSATSRMRQTTPIRTFWCKEPSLPRAT